MCGICGQVVISSRGVADADAARAVRDAMAARGPDGHGEWSDPQGAAWLGHRRLSIVDLSPAGAQPMTLGDGRFTMVYNGEIYNHPELRAELVSHGHRFDGHSDSETLLRLFAEEGLSAIGRLRGMFAFAIWDAQKRTLTAARDPLGIKPFYYSEAKGVLRFASQVKALLKDPAIPRDADLAGLAGFGIFGSVPEPFTTFSAISALPAGHLLVAQAGQPLRIERYHEFQAPYRSAEEQAGSAFTAEDAEEIRDALADSVRAHLMADVPVGAFLSAGIDSGSLVGLMRDAGYDDISTITLTYDELRGTSADEGPLAAQTAARYGTKHHETRIDRDHFLTHIDSILTAMDQPSVDGVNTWLVSKAAHDAGLKVAMSGVGGDELFGGYDTFRTVPKMHRIGRALHPLRFARPIAGMIANRLRSLGLAIHPKAVGLLGDAGTFAQAYILQRCVFLPAELTEILRDGDAVRRGVERLRLESMLGRATDGLGQPFTRVAAMETAFYMRNQLLRDTDWAGMAHSLEIRTPLVDSELHRRIAPLLLKTGRRSGKTLLGEAPAKGLPDAILDRPKTGFSVPVRRWIDPGAGKSRQGDRLFSRSWGRRILARRSQLGPMPAIAADQS